MNLNNMLIVGYCYFELVIVDVDGFVMCWKMFKCLYYQIIDSVDFFIVKVGVECFVEVFNGSQCVYGLGMMIQLMEVDIIFFVIFVFNFINNQFQDVFNGYQIGNFIEFVNNDCYVVMLRVKFFQYLVYVFIFRNDNCLM